MKQLLTLDTAKLLIQFKDAQATAQKAVEDAKRSEVEFSFAQRREQAALIAARQAEKNLLDHLRTALASES